MRVTDYFSKWSEAIALKNARDEHVITFFQDTTFSRFGLPLSIVSNNGPAFSSVKFVKFCVDLNTKHYFSCYYYPQGNGFVEYTNKKLIKILKKITEDKSCQWHLNFPYALWADRTTVKSSTATTPFQFLFGE